MWRDARSWATQAITLRFAHLRFLLEFFPTHAP
jgi:hypothetical protein